MLTLERIVWLHALRTMCVMNYAPLCTFPFHTMESRQLERAALRPYLFMAKISSPASWRLRERRIDFDPETSCESSQSEDDPITSVKCVPGGRYMVTTSTYYRMTVWDFGPATNENTNPVLIKEIEFPSEPLLVHALPVDPISNMRILFVLKELTG